MFGYMGKVLRINLSNKECKFEDLNEKSAYDYIGCRGLGVKTYINEVDPNVEPLSEENKVVIATGPLTGTIAPTGGRYMVITKSPLTNTIGIANSGGFWGTQLKRAGIDMIIVEGKSQNPVYIVIEDEKVEIKDASHIWGSVVSKTTETLKMETSDKHKVLCIGPAGENLSPMAAVMNDVERAAGRGGLGAVLGSKNLKAIVARGTKSVEIADKEKFREVVKEKSNKLRNDPVGGSGLPTYGTAVLVNIINENGMHPVKNFQGSYTDPDIIEPISGESLTKDHLTRNTHCASCPIGCGREVKLRDGKVVGGPEYETIWSFGADCNMFDMNYVNEANMLCNEYGLDTISAGATIASAMELYEKGYISIDDIKNDEATLNWGDGESIIKWVEKMGKREGFGDKLAEGSHRLCEKYSYPEASMTVKKQEIAAYDPRGAKGIGLNYATNNRGGCHIKGYMINPEILGYPEKLDRFASDLEKVKTTINIQNLTAVIDALGMCVFTTFGLKEVQDYVDLYNSCCGTDHTEESLMNAGDRIWNLERLYNLNSGFTKCDDTLPNRLLEEPVSQGPSKGEIHPLEEMLEVYYKERGWNEDGVITLEKLNELGLEEYRFEELTSQS
jgi:aldehyde:ferredoxin oxidoreductase